MIRRSHSLLHPRPSLARTLSLWGWDGEKGLTGGSVTADNRLNFIVPGTREGVRVQIIDIHAVDDSEIRVALLRLDADRTGDRS